MNQEILESISILLDKIPQEYMEEREYLSLMRDKFTAILFLKNITETHSKQGK